MSTYNFNHKSERIPRRFCLTPVVLPVGSASAAGAAGSFNLLPLESDPISSVSGSNHDWSHLGLTIHGYTMNKTVGS